jgi:GMP synthase-like glutamine amidotransferase
VRVLHVHHDANSETGIMGPLMEQREFESTVHRVCETPGSPVGSDVFPDPLLFDCVVLYGSRWSVHDPEVAHWVEPELEFIRAADRAGVPVLGLCFGGQMLSVALGGTVAPSAVPEVGWARVTPTAAEIEPGPWLQWHFDSFTVPSGAEELARSVSGPQAFRLRRNLGLQFHPEADRAVLESWLMEDFDQLAELGVRPSELLDEADRQVVAATARADRLLRGFLGC